MKKTVYSVTNFLHCGNDYLFIHRTKRANKVDGNRLNGIGGKLEKEENFLQAAIRETLEETGYVVTVKDIQLAGVVRMQGGYMDNWSMNFFKIEVPTKEVPLGLENDEGKLIWLPAEKVLTSGYELVDDLNYCFPEIVKNNIPFFVHAQMTEEEKVKTWNVSYLK